MKKLLFLICLSSLFMTACQKTVDPPVAENILQEQQKIPHCGMEEAMANMSSEMKQAMLSNRLISEAQAAELLIFLDFDGAIVRRENGNAQGGDVTSPLVSNTRTCSAPNLTTE
ncbi:MAG: hypothetical protein SGI83_17250 [Bacteroidota bacterium]|nr:hypothetical protein [Bacteroidota bacterium]